MHTAFRHNLLALYVGCADRKQIEVLHYDCSRNTVDRIQAADVPGPAGPSRTSMPLALARNHHLLYAAIRCSSYSVSSFRVDSANGRLPWVAAASLDDEPVFLATDLNDALLLVAS